MLDETVSTLDVAVQARILDLLATLQRELGLTDVFVSHDLAAVWLIAGTIPVMRGGWTSECGPVGPAIPGNAGDLIEAAP